MTVFKGSIPKEIRYWYTPEEGHYHDAPSIKSFMMGWTHLGGHFDRRKSVYNRDFIPYDYKGQTAEVLNPTRKVPEIGEIVTTANTPMTGLRVIGHYHHKSRNDQFWIILPNEYTVKMEFDTFMEVLLNEGIGKNGELPGEWVWAKCPGDMRLVRLGTGMHQAILDYNNRSKKPVFDLKKFTPGHFYKKPDGRMAIFCGFVNTESMSLRVHPDDRKMTKESSYYYNHHGRSVRFDIKFTPIKLATLWYEVYDFIDEERMRMKEEQEEMTKAVRKKDAYRFKVIKKHEYIEPLNISIDMPDDIIARVRSMAGRWINSNGGKKTKQPSINGARAARDHSTLANMMPYGMKSIRPSALTIFTPFIRTTNNEISKAVEVNKFRKKKTA